MADSTTQKYLNDISRSLLLTAEEEIKLARDIKIGLHADATPRQRRLAQRAKDRFVRSNMKLAIDAAKKHVSRCNTLELTDLAQEGVFGIVRAAEKFDPEKGFKFSTYAYPWLRHFIKRAINNQDRLIRLPEHVHEKVYRFKKVSESSTKLGNHKTINELAKEADTSIEYLAMADKVLEISSLDFVTEQGTSLIELVASDSCEISCWELFGLERRTFEEAFKLLDAREGMVLRKYYGIGEDSLTMPKIGKQLGLSRERVRQIKAEAESKFRAYLLEQGAYL